MFIFFEIHLKWLQSLRREPRKKKPEAESSAPGVILIK
ncbi:hypothetical protein BSG1_16525 [Bacillus sp. SG-1]|nr:hypothetical protein BSG1_16525 [Bacillus sp. SG-1]